MPLRRPLLLCSVLALGMIAPVAQASKDDRTKPLNLVFDREGAIDKVRQRSEFNGNVIMTKGSMELRAERMDVQETSDGYYQAYANGTSAKQVHFRQDRDTPGERIEGRADQIEYDTRTETIRLVGNAEARVMQGDQLKQALSGATLNYDNRTERLIAGARKEGALTVYSSAQIAVMTAVGDAFEKKYGVKFTLWRGSSEQIVQRVQAEARAGRLTADVMETAGPSMEAANRLQLLQTITTPLTAELMPEASAPGRPWITSRTATSESLPFSVRGMSATSRMHAGTCRGDASRRIAARMRSASPAVSRTPSRSFTKSTMCTSPCHSCAIARLSSTAASRSTWR